MKIQFLTSRPALALGFAMIILTGCNVGPKYVRPQMTAPPVYRGADEAAISSDAQNSLGDQQWLTVFRELELQKLIRTALANNYDLRIAAQRVLEASAQLRVTRSQQFPQITVGGSGIGAGFSSGQFGSSIDSPLAIGSLSLSASWTPDFWGLYRNQTEAARDQMLAQTWGQRAVRMTLVEQVATTYIQLRALDRQLEIARQASKVRQDSVELTRTLAQGGDAPLSDVREAEQLLYTATSQIPQIQQQIQQNENAMRLLLGQNPGPIAHSDPGALAPAPEDLPTGLPSQLLERRPDIQQAEAQLKAANAQIGVARAQLFPQLSISSSGEESPTASARSHSPYSKVASCADSYSFRKNKNKRWFSTTRRRSSAHYATLPMRSSRSTSSARRARNRKNLSLLPKTQHGWRAFATAAERPVILKC
jgi:multidrug efflux system outer membrane protein